VVTRLHAPVTRPPILIKALAVNYETLLTGLGAARGIGYL
jgi:hypothetical protein